MSTSAHLNGTSHRATLRVVIADDHPFYRDGLAKLLHANGIDVAAQAANGEAAIQAVAETAPDVVVMDLNMPGMSGLEATRQLTQIAPMTRVLVLSVSAQEDDVTEAILAGASGYVLKESPVEEVVAGIQAAAAGQALISPRVATLLLGRLREQAQAQRDVSSCIFRARARRARPARRRQGEPRDRRSALHQPQHRAQPRGEHPREAARGQPRASGRPGRTRPDRLTHR